MQSGTTLSPLSASYHGKTYSSEKAEKNELLFMIIIDQLPVPSGGDNDGDLEDLSPWNNNKDDEELRSRRQSTASVVAVSRQL